MGPKELLVGPLYGQGDPKVGYGGIGGIPYEMGPKGKNYYWYFYMVVWDPKLFLVGVGVFWKILK